MNENTKLEAAPGENAARLRAGPQGYLYLLADHIERPDLVTFDDIAASLQGADSLFSIKAGHPEAEARRRLREWVDSLKARDPAPWAKLLAGMLGDPSSLKQGIGARLKALSPFEGKALVTLELRYGMTDFGGDASALFSYALMDASHELRAGDRFVVALDHDALKGAQVVRTREGRS